jgi:hypothetical protein
MLSRFYSVSEIILNPSMLSVCRMKRSWRIRRLVKKFAEERVPERIMEFRIKIDLNSLDKLIVCCLKKTPLPTLPNGYKEYCNYFLRAPEVY